MVPGTRNGLNASLLMLAKATAHALGLWAQVDDSTLLEKETSAREAFKGVLSKAFKDGQKLQFSEVQRL